MDTGEIQIQPIWPYWLIAAFVVLAISLLRIVYFRHLQRGIDGRRVAGLVAKVSPPEVIIKTLTIIYGFNDWSG